MKHFVVALALLVPSVAFAQQAPADPVLSAVQEMGAENAVLRVQLASLKRTSDEQATKLKADEKQISDLTARTASCPAGKAP